MIHSVEALLVVILIPDRRDSESRVCFFSNTFHKGESWSCEVNAYSGDL